ncbi:MAG: hypothetical protein WA906_11800 [Pacificimonas sp.]
MFNAANSNVLRSTVALIGAALLTATTLAGTIGPDPRAESFYSDTQIVSASVTTEIA